MKLPSWLKPLSERLATLALALVFKNNKLPVSAAVELVEAVKDAAGHHQIPSIPQKRSDEVTTLDISQLSVTLEAPNQPAQ